MKRVTLTICTDNRSYTVQGPVSDINALFDHLVSETLNPQANSYAHKGFTGESYSDPVERSSDSDTKNCCDEQPPTAVENPDKVCNCGEQSCTETGEQRDSGDTHSKEYAPAGESIKAPKKGETEEVAEATDAPDDKVVEDNEPPQKYKGFLLIKCEHCGEVRGFNTRNEISEYKCDCGGTTQLGHLIPFTALCECGKRWRYMTNLTEESYELNCIHCGSPIPVFYNDRKRKYETLLESLPTHKKGKKGKKAGK